MNKGTQQVFLFAPLVPPAHEAEHESSPALKELYKMASLHSECSQKTVPLKELAEINPRLKSKPPAPWTEVFFIPMSDITETGRWQFRQTRLYNEVCRGGFTCFGEGDVLFAKITPCMENGKGCLVTDLDGSLGFGSTEFHILRARSEGDAGYIFQWTLDQMLRRQAKNAMTGSAGQQRVPSSFLANFCVPAFPKAEQSKIAEILSTLDRAIEQTEALIAKQQRIKTGLMQDLLTRGIDEQGKVRADSGDGFLDGPFGTMPREWTINSLSNLASVQRGKFSHRPRNDPAFYGGDFPFIQTNDVANNTGQTLTTYEQTLNKRGVSVSKEFPVGTIAVTIAANIADTAILGTAMYFPDSLVGVCAIVPNNARFLEMALRRWKPILDQLAPQSAQKNINLDTLRPLPIPTPSPSEQDKIASLYESTVQHSNLLVTSLKKLTALKKSLMQDLLGGKRRVTPLLSSAPIQ